MLDEPLHKCAECGFLTLRNRFTGELDEMDRDYRETGKLPIRRAVGGSPAVQYLGGGTPTGNIWPYQNIPLCFVQRYLLFEETHAGKDLALHYDGDTPDMAHEVITKPRDCTPSAERLGFVKWEMGFTPKEHREMLDRQWRLDYEERVRESVERREDARDIAMNAREAARDEKSEQWHSTDLRTLQSQHRWQLFWFGVAVVIATVVGSMIQAGWIGKPW